MRNQEQIRARNALRFAKEHGPKVRGSQGGEVIKKLPSLILNHGLLATAAYSYTEKEGWMLTFDAIAQHLSDPDIAILKKARSRQDLMEQLTSDQATSQLLRLATAESMAWLGFARRFVKEPLKSADS